MKESYNRDPLVTAAENLMVTEDVAKIQKKVAQLKVGDKTNYGTVKEIGAASITFKAPQTPKTKIAFRQRKMGSPDYLLMNLVKFTPDGKGVDKSFKEANDFTGAAAAAKVAGEDEFEFNGETYPVTISLDVAKKIMSQSLELAKKLSKDMEEDRDFSHMESNEFVGAAAAAKVAGEDEFEFNGKTYPVEISQETAEKIMSQAIDLAKDMAKAKKERNEAFEKEIVEEQGSLKNSLAVLAKAGIKGRFPDLDKLVKAIRKNYKAITGEKYEGPDQVAMSEVLADLIVHYRLDGEDFIAAWDKNIKESTELEESTNEKFIKDVAKDFGATLNTKDIKWIENKLKNVSDEDFYYELKHLIVNFFAKESTDLEEAEGEEWFTAETLIKSSGQLYSTFWVQAKNMSDAKKKADKVFKELISVSFPKSSDNVSRNFTLRVKKGDNLGDLMP